MIFRLITSLPPNLIRPRLIRNLKILKPYMNLTKYPRLNKYLLLNYNTTLQNVIDVSFNNLIMTSTTLQKIEITFNDVPVGKSTLNELLKLIEYGNLSIKGTELISNLYKTAIDYTMQEVGI